MALDFAGDGVRVNAVAPGSVDTPMLRWAVGLDQNPEALMRTVHGMHPLGRIAAPREVAEAVAFLASDARLVRDRRDARRRRRPALAAKRRARREQGLSTPTR